MVCGRGRRRHGEKYVSVGQNTLYLKKYNVQGSKPFTHQYMTNVGAANSEGIKLAKAYDQSARQAALEFVIPVYDNMPDAACRQPAGDGSPNYLLSSLSIDGYSLTPAFDKYQTEYDVIVPYGTSSIKVNAQALDPSASVKGAGYINLKVGMNDVDIIVTAGNGSTKTYHLTIARQEAVKPDPEPTEPTVPEPSVHTSLKLEGGQISGMPKVPISASELIAMVSVTNGSAELTDASGNGKSGNAATGDVLRIKKKDGSVYARYVVLIYGDGNGDGKISILDLIKAQNNVLKISASSGVKFTALDVNRDGKISILDLIKIQNCILKLGDI